LKPETRYAKSDGVHIGYQVLGDGPADIVYVPGWVSNVEYAWEEQSMEHFLRRLASFSRLVMFDKRGTGTSDKVNELPTLEQRMDDVRAVMDTVGIQRATLLGVSEGGPMCALFAATYPSRTTSLILYGSYAKRLKSSDYPWAPSLEERHRWFDLIEQGWGGTVDLGTLAPSVAGSKSFTDWWAAYLRMSASPRDALALAQMNTEIDIRNVLPSIHVPTLVLHRRGDRDIVVGNGKYLAVMIPNSKFVELPGEDHLPWVGDADILLDEIEEFVTGVRPTATKERVLATVLFTDIVDSTARAVELGDAKWKELLGRHNSLVRKELSRFRGREIKSTGDGFLATFDGPARAIGCALAVRDGVRSIGLEIRTGLHTGECELVGEDIAGVAVHIASRIMAAAQAGDVLVSSTVKDLVAGSGYRFVDRGTHQLKGVQGDWELFSVGLH
jgi:class 3 adenylate cyclase